MSTGRRSASARTALCCLASRSWVFVVLQLRHQTVSPPYSVSWTVRGARAGGYPIRRLSPTLVRRGSRGIGHPRGPRKAPGRPDLPRVTRLDRATDRRHQTGLDTSGTAPTTRSVPMHRWCGHRAACRTQRSVRAGWRSSRCWCSWPLPQWSWAAGWRTPRPPRRRSPRRVCCPPQARPHPGRWPRGLRLRASPRRPQTALQQPHLVQAEEVRRPARWWFTWSDRWSTLASYACLQGRGCRTR